jgi:GT2 family glycosyltransferase
MSKPSVAVIILSWKNPDVTIDTVESFLKIRHKHFNYKIFLVDNHSPDDTFQVLSKRYSANPKIILSQTESNLGYVGGNNFGIKQVLAKKYKYLLIANSDILVKDNFLEILIQSFSLDERIALIGPKIYFAPGHEFQKHYHPNDLGKVIWSAGGVVDWDNVQGSNVGIDDIDHGQYDTPSTNLDYISGCCFIIKTSLIKKIGLLDEKYFMYLEDVDYCQRIKKIGYKILYQPNSIIWHINAGSSQAGGGSLHDYFLTRNRLIFGMRYAKLRTRMALVRQAVSMLLFSGTVWQKKGITDYFLHHLGKGSWH